MTTPYLCGECGESMTRVPACVPYPECGLDNVRLHQVPVWECVNGHRDLQVPAVDELHQVLALAIITQSWRLKGQEVRFLRKHLGYTARHFSSLIGLSHVTLSRFENNRVEIPRKMDALVRLFAAQVFSEKTHTALPTPVIPVLQELEAGGSTLTPHDQCIEHVDTGEMAKPRHVWQPAVAC